MYVMFPFLRAPPAFHPLLPSRCTFSLHSFPPSSLPTSPTLSGAASSAYLPRAYPFNLRGRKGERGSCHPPRSYRNVL